jgi:hypothetical protein
MNIVRYEPFDLNRDIFGHQLRTNSNGDIRLRIGGLSSELDGGADNFSDSFSPEEVTTPNTIKISGRLLLKEMTALQRKVMAFYHDNCGQNYKPVALYDQNHAISGLEIWAEHLETSDGNILKQIDKTLCCMNFTTQTEPIHVHFSLPDANQTGVWRETMSHLIPVYAYGGFYQKGCGLDEIRPVYCDVSVTAHQQTIIHLRNHFRDEQAYKICGLDHPIPNYPIPKTSQYNHPLSLLNHIQLGSFRYDFETEGIVVSYRSALVMDYDPHTLQIKILFIKN